MSPWVLIKFLLNIFEFYFRIMSMKLHSAGKHTETTHKTYWVKIYCYLFIFFMIWTEHKNIFKNDSNFLVSCFPSSKQPWCFVKLISELNLVNLQQSMIYYSLHFKLLPFNQDFLLDNLYFTMQKMEDFHEIYCFHCSMTEWKKE